MRWRTDHVSAAGGRARAGMASPTAWRTTAAGRLTWSQGGQGRDTGSPGCDQAWKASTASRQPWR